MKYILALILLFTNFFIALAIPEDSALVQQLMENGEKALSNKQYNKAEKEFLKAAEIFHKNNRYDQYIKSITRSGKAIYQQDKIERAKLFFDSVYHHIVKPDLYRSPENAHFLEEYGKVLNLLEEKTQTLTLWTTAKDIYIHFYGAEYELLGEFYEEIGWIYFDLYQFRKFIDWFNKAVNVYQANHGPEYIEIGEAYFWIGRVYSFLMEYRKTLDYYFKSLYIYTLPEYKEQFSVAGLFNNIGLAYYDLKEYDEALTYVNKAIETRKKEGKTKSIGIAINYNSLGLIHIGKKDFEKALDHFQESRERKEQIWGADNVKMDVVHINIGDVYYELKDYEKARESYQKAYRILNKKYDPFNNEFGLIYQRLAQVEEDQENFNEAANQVQKALKCYFPQVKLDSAGSQPVIRDMHFNHIMTLLILKTKSRILAGKYLHSKNINDLKLSHDTYQLTAQIIDKVRKEMGNRKARQVLSENNYSFYEKYLGVVDQLYQLTGEAKYLEEAFTIIEKNKSNLLYESLLNSYAQANINIPDSLLEKENKIDGELAFFEKQLYEVKNESEDREKESDLQNKIFQLTKQKEELTAIYKQQYPNYYYFKFNNESISIQQLQDQLLDNKTLLVEYFFGDSSIFTFSVSKEKAHLAKINGKDQKDKIENYIQVLSERKFSENHKLSHEIYNLLIEPTLSAHNYKIDHLKIIPDGIIGYLPFETLLESTDDQKKGLPFLIRRFTVDYHYSADLLAFNSRKKKQKAKHKFIGFAPSFVNPPDMIASRSADNKKVYQLSALNYAQEEVKDIATLYEGNYKVENNATETYFRQFANSYDMLHIASHTLIDNANPLYSKMVFSDEDSVNDGLLHTYELYNMKIEADLVALSACNTGVGKIKRGEGVESLARGFMYAGVKNMLMSLWSVADFSTARIMKDFYRQLKQGKNYSEALRLAKLQYLKTADEVMSDPYYWSGFIIISDIEKDNSNNLYLFIGLISGFLLFLYFAWSRYK